MSIETKPIGSYVRNSKKYSWESKVTLGGNVEERIEKGEIPIYNDSLYVSGYCNEDKADYAVYRGKELLGVIIECYETNGVNYYSWRGVPGSRKEFYSKLDLEVKLEKEKYEQRLNKEKYEQEKKTDRQ